MERGQNISEFRNLIAEIVHVLSFSFMEYIHETKYFNFGSRSYGEFIFQFFKNSLRIIENKIIHQVQFILSLVNYFILLNNN